MVMFWDTSAVVPLLLHEPGSPVVRSIAEADPALTVWWGTRTECLSALHRRHRDGDLTAEAVRLAQHVLQALDREWTEVLPHELVRKRAERLLGLHAIRAADAMQLAAALVWSRDDPAGHGFVCLDDRLGAAAAREGFELLPAP